MLFRRLSVLFGLALWLNAASAAVPLPSPPTIPGSSHILMDFRTGTVLAEHNPDERVEPASITKVMTTYVVFKQIEAGTLSLEDMVTISEKAWRAPGSRMFIEVGKQISVQDLLKGVVIHSGNDASIALAEHVAGTEDSFADLMNQYAAQLGLTGSHFVNATGLPHADHYVTARDVAVLSRAMIRDFPDYYEWYSEREFTWNGIRQSNRNPLLYRDDRVDGIKTGHTESAGYCLVSSAEDGEMRLISVVMGTGSDRERADASQALLNYGFRFFETHKLYAAGAELSRTRIWKGAEEEVGLAPAEDIYVTIPRGRYEELDAVMDLGQTIVAPVQPGDVLGVVRVALDGQELARAPLTPVEAVEEGGLFRRLVDSVMMLFE